MDKLIFPGNNTVYVYDGTFDGFLTTVFDIYATKREPVQIVCERRWQPNFFDIATHVVTSMEKSERVWKSVVERSNVKVSRMLFLAYASELPDIEMNLFRYLEKFFADTTGHFYKNLLDDHSFSLYQAARKVRGEVHRFYGFVRFQETTDGLFFSVIDPDHNILPLLGPHFANRYSGQPWVIYDSKRDKGIYYNCKELQEISLSDKQFNKLTGDIKQEIEADDEQLYRKLWKAYYKAINIPERKNTKLMLRLLPRRYWKYLPEKQHGHNEQSGNMDN